MNPSSTDSAAASLKVYDISMPIYRGMPVYKDNWQKQPEFETTADFPGQGIHETRIHIDVHTGTHVDAPLHMVANGSAMESVSLAKLVRPCRVIDLTAVTGGVTSSDLIPHQIKSGEFVLLKTRNSFRKPEAGFDPEFVFVAEDGALYLAKQQVSGVGIDALGIERGQPGHPTHKVLFSSGAVIVEGLQLADVPPGDYFLIAAPLRLMGTDAAPARTLLLSGQLPL